MKTFILIAALLAGSIVSGQSASVPVVKRAAIMAMEKSFDSTILNANRIDPFDLLGSTQGVYIKGFGAVFTAQVDLIYTPRVNPFKLVISKEDVVKIHARKLQRIPLLKKNMRQMLLNSAASLDTVPLNEQIVLAVNVFYYSWENTAGLPSQIVMQASRQDLLQRPLTESRIKMEEF